MTINNSGKHTSFFQPVFSRKDVSALVRESIDVILMDAHYSKDRVTSWTNKVTEQTLVALTKLQMPYKYIGMSSMSQKNLQFINHLSPLQ